MNELEQHTGLNQRKFDSWSSSYEDRRYDFFRRMQGRVLSRIELTPGAFLLDIGCGTGWAVRQAARMVGPRGAAYGIDLSRGMIERARQSARGITNATFLEANAQRIPLPDSFFGQSRASPQAWSGSLPPR